MSKAPAWKLVANAEDGQTLVEWGMIVFFVSIMAIAALGVVGTNIIALLGDAGDALTDVLPGG